MEVFGWKPGIGDPTIYGWLTVAAYALGAILCWRAAQHATPRERRFWLLLTAVMAFLCVNKQLDLQTLFTDIARDHAKRHGWYERRRDYQEGFIAVLTFGFAAVIAWLSLRSTRASRTVRTAIAGLALLMLFILVRASSFDKVDWILSRHLGSLEINHTLELGSIAIVATSAWLAAGGLARQR